MSEVLANLIETEKETSSLSQKEANEKNTSSLDSSKDLSVEELESAVLEATTDLDKNVVCAHELDDPDEPTQIASRSVALEDSGVIPIVPMLQGKEGSTSLSLLEKNGLIAQRNPYKSASMCSLKDYEQQSSVGYMLSYFRKQSGQSIQDVARRLCVRPTTIADIEADKLNYRTCMEFASNVIHRYSILIGLMPDLMVYMYKQAVLKNDPDNDSDALGDSKNKGMHTRMWLLVFVILFIVAGVGYYYYYYYFDLKDPLNEDLVASIHGSENLEPLDSAFSLTSADNNVISASNNNELIELGHISDASVIAAQGANATANVEGLGNEKVPQVVIETDGNPFLAGGKVNTTEKTLGTDDKRAEESVPPPVLSLPSEVPTLDGQGVLGANIDQGPMLLDRPINVNGRVNTSMRDGGTNKNKVDQQVKAASEQMQALQNQFKVSAANDALASEDNIIMVANEKAAQNVSVENAAQTVALDNKLKNISSQVKIVNRDTLGSLNRVNITINSDVSLRVLDKNKNVLVQGVYKKGNTVTATGIPPLTIQASNTRALEISYSGGQLRMPREQQVQFELPMR